jgi:hypothetical protein
LVIASVFYVNIQYHQHPFVEDVIFSPVHVLDSFVKNQMVIAMWIYLWVFYSVSCLFLCQFHAFYYYDSVVQLVGRYCDTSNIELFVQDYFGSSRSSTSIWILGSTYVSLWRLSLEFWWALHWTYGLFLVV